MNFLPESIDEYALAHTDQESDLLADLNRNTYARILQPRMLSGHLQGRTLAAFSQMMRPRRILEIGTYTGYSALCLAEGLSEDGMLHTIDINEELEDFAGGYFQRADLQEKIVQHIGNALDIIPSLEEEWDMVFIDADKENYSVYFDLVIDRLRAGGLIIADNVLWSGKVVEAPASKDLETKALIEFNTKVHNDRRVENLLLPIRDGLMLCRKR